MNEIEKLNFGQRQVTEVLSRSIETPRQTVEAIQKSFERQGQFSRALLTQSGQLADALKPPSDILRPFTAYLRQADRSAEALLRHITPVPTLKRRQIASLSAQLARAVEPYRAANKSISDWQASLTARMESLTTSWKLLNRLDHPMIGFARLARLSDAVHTVESYSAPVSELIADELGNGVETQLDDSAHERDSAAVRAGLNPEVIALPPASYGEVVLAAGFDIHLAHMPVPQAIESADPGAVFDPKNWELLTQLEQRLRHVVEETLIQLVGPNWIRQRVSKPIRQRWEERQEEDRISGRPVYAPIQYADFMDLADVIGQSNNWSEAFQPIFKNRADFILSLRRLHPVRKAIGHSRPMGRADVLILFSEATRIFTALGIRILN